MIAAPHTVLHRATKLATELVSPGNRPRRVPFVLAKNRSRPFFESCGSSFFGVAMCRKESDATPPGAASALSIQPLLASFYCSILDTTTLVPTVCTRKKAMIRRFHVQFSLRLLFFVVLIVGSVVGYMARAIHQARLQRLAVAEIERQGGQVFYDYQFMENGDTIYPPPSPPGPAWLRGIVGDDFFREVVHVNLKHGGFNHLSDLPSMEGLFVPSSLFHGDDSHIDSLRELVHLRNLSIWDDSGPREGLLAPLSQLTQLQQLCVSKTLLTKEEVVELRRALPNCVVCLVQTE